MANKIENQIIHLKTSSKYYCHIGFSGGPHTSACQNDLPKETPRERVKMIKKMDFVELVKNGQTQNLCPVCMEILNPTKISDNKFIPRTAMYSLKRVSGSVTRKADGKLSYSINNARYHSYTAKAAFKKLGEEIVAANFEHPAVYSVTADNLGGLIERLRTSTTDLKEIYIEKTKKYASEYFDHCIKLNKLTELDWLQRYNVKYTEYKHSNGSINFYPTSFYSKEYKRMSSVKNEMQTILNEGFESYTNRMVRSAERHYEDSLVKLSNRLNQKGIKDDTNFTIKSGRIGMNFELTIEHESLITKAWTIIAEGPIQRPHYRYLVK